MGVEIVSIQYTDDYTGSGATKNDFIMGSFGDKITAYITVAVHWETLNIQAVFDTASDTIRRNDNYSFIRDGFKKGDLIDVTGTGTVADNQYTIDSVTDSTITTVEAIPVSGIYSLVSIYGQTQVNALDFYCNLIENSAPLSFVSLTDNQSVQKYSASKSNWVSGETVTATQATQSIGWQTGVYPTIEKTTDGTAVDDYKQTFVITHTFLITPLYLSGDLVEVNEKLVYPSYFLDTNSLKYVARIDARYDTINPSIPHTTDPQYEYPYGNIGWFGEFLNGGFPEYSLDSVSYVDILTSLPVDEIQIQRTTKVIAVINSDSGSFTGSPLMEVKFFYCPQDQGDYVGTKNTNLLDNYRADRQLITVGTAPVNGVRAGGAYQSLMNISASIDSPTQATLTFDVDLSQQTQSYLIARSEENRKVMFTVTPQKEASTMLADTDRNIVLIGFQSASYNQDDSTLLTWNDILFYQYPDLTTNAYTDYKGFIGDHILAKSLFTVKNTGTPQDITIEIQVVNSVTGAFFNLQKHTQQFPASEVNGGIICDSNQPTVLGYSLPADDIRNQVFLYRNPALDTATNFGWEIDYGFVLRYETWRDVPEFNEAFSCEHSQDWSTYTLMPDWDIKFKITVNVEKEDYVTTFERYANIEAFDDTVTSDGFGGELTMLMETFYTGNSGFVDAKGVIFSDQDTHVRLTFTGNFSSLPSGATGYYGYLALDIPNTGGEFTRDICTSEEYPLETSVWDVQAVITAQSATEITIESDIDYTKLDPQVQAYILTGRLGFKY